MVVGHTFAECKALVLVRVNGTTTQLYAGIFRVTVLAMVALQPTAGKGKCVAVRSITRGKAQREFGRIICAHFTARPMREAVLIQANDTRARQFRTGDAPRVAQIGYAIGAHCSRRAR